MTANADVSLLDLVETTSVANGDLLLIVRDPTGAPTTNTATVNAFVASIANNLIIKQQTPANSTITITQGMMLYDNTYLYIATANNTLKRITLTAF